MNIPKSGFIATVAAVLCLTAIAIVCIRTNPELIVPHLAYIIITIGGIAKYYAGGRLKKDIREKDHNGTL